MGKGEIGSYLCITTINRLLDEGPPQELINKYSMSTLEEVFLALCKSEDQTQVTTHHSGNPDRMAEEAIY
jgi:hypothetical protein